MCKYCEKRAQIENDLRCAFVTIENSELVFDETYLDTEYDEWDVYKSSIHINYCPFCGRKLNNL